jgi:hypothetical protein
VLALYGSESDLADQALWLESLLPGCRTVVLPWHEHSVLVEAPQRVGELVLDWVREHGSGPRAESDPAPIAGRGPAPLVEVDAR